MITKIFPSDRDISSLDLLARVSSQASFEQPEDYQNKVVIKPWGYEYLIFENAHVAIWYLFIKGGHSTSMHCHPMKRTSLVLLRGSAVCHTLSHRNSLKDFGGLILEKGVFHSTQSVSDEGIHLIEVESPPNKTDLVRLNDKYGREQSGYERMSEMRTENLERYSYFHLTEPGPDEEREHTTNGYRMTMSSYSRDEAFQGAFDIEADTFYTSCKGILRAEDGRTILDTGECLSGRQIASVGKPRIDTEVVLLSIRFSGVARSHENN